MRIGWALLATLLLPGAAFAQSGGQPSPYRYCSVRSGELSLVRSVARGSGKVAFQSSLGNHLLGPREREFDAFFAWPGALSDAPMLWVSADWMTYISAGSIAIVIGDANDRDEAIFRRADRGDVTLFEVDPQALLRRFPGRREVKLVFRSQAGARLLAAATIDLEALRRELDAAAGLAARFAGEAGECSDTTLLRKEADPARYQCSINDNGPPTWIGASPWRFTWQYRLSPGTYLDASRSPEYSLRRDEDAFLAQLRQGFAAGGTPYLSLRVASASGLYRRTDLTAEFVGAGGRLTFALKDGVTIPWDRLRALGSGPIAFAVRDSAGVAIETFTIPAGLLDQVDARVGVLAGRLVTMRESVMQQCEPEADIVVT